MDVFVKLTVLSDRKEDGTYTVACEYTPGLEIPDIRTILASAAAALEEVT